MNTSILWDNSNCEPVIITYNRSSNLNITLEKFFATKNLGMRLHVLDNASTDDTYQIVKNWQKDWPELIYHKNKYNIGGNANILRALEINNSTYVWIIGDDDLWHLENINKLIEVFTQQDADIIRLGWLASNHSMNKLESARKLFADENYFFASLSMISATIIRRELIINYLPLSYHNIYTAYTQLVPLINCFNKVDMQVYTLEKPLLTHTPSQNVGYFAGDLEWYCGWFALSKLFSDKKHKKKFNAEIIKYMTRNHETRFAGFIWILKVVLNAKAKNIPQAFYIGQMLLNGYGFRFKLFIISMIYSVLPYKFLKYLRVLYYDNKTPAASCDRTRL